MVHGHLHFLEEHEIQNLSFIVDNQVKFKAEELSHGAYPTFGKSFEGLVDQYQLVAAEILLPLYS